jgi:arylsulfatase A-like enzyme
MLMADHLRFDCLAPSGRKFGVQTPHVDALAAESVMFNGAYCATRLWVSTRTAIATGKWPHKTGVIINGGAVEDPRKPFGTFGPGHGTFYEALNEAGYRFTLTGVQHVHSDPCTYRKPHPAMLTSVSPGTSH